VAISFKVSGTQGLIRALSRAGARAPHEGARALYIEGEKIMAASKQEAPVGVDGVLRASGFVDPPQQTPEGTRIQLGYGGASKTYAIVVHEGRKPGSKMPPPKALEPWVRKKLGVPADEVASVSFAVARKIAETGTEPTKFLEHPFRAAIPGMADRMAKRIRKSLESK
jgi:hypothetical protein